MALELPRGTERDLRKEGPLSPHPGFVPLQEFWADYLRAFFVYRHQTLDAASLASYLDSFFGALTAHRFDDLGALPIRGVGTECRNNTHERRPSICETHVGAVRGVLETHLGVPLEISYDPQPCRECRLHIAVRGTAKGDPVVARARRRDRVRLYDTPPTVVDTDTGRRTSVTRETLSLLGLLDDFTTARELSANHRLDLRRVASLLDYCLREGWIDHDFTTTSKSSVP